MKLNRAHFTLTLLLSSALAVNAVPVVAYADTAEQLQSRVDEAYSTLQTYTQELELVNNQLVQVQDDLSSVQEQIKQTETEIDEKQAELEEGQAALSERLASSYKQGNASLISVVLGVSDFGELFSRVYYANKIAERDADLVNTVKQLKSELEQKQSDLAAQEQQQKQLVSEQEQKASEAQNKINAQQSYYASLDSELQSQLAAEAAAREAEAAAQAAAEQQAQQAQQNNQNQETTSNEDTSDNQGGTTTEQPSGGSQTQTPSTGGSTTTTPEQPSSPSSPSKPSTPTKDPDTDKGNTDSGSAPSSVVDYATAQVGKSYVWGGSGPDVFDCSGLTSYAYRQVGITIPHSSQSQYNLVASKGHLVYSVSYLKPGDLVFWGTGGSGSAIYHVGMYIGGGRYVHASMPGVGVVIGTLSTGGNFAGGGSPV